MTIPRSDEIVRPEQVQAMANLLGVMQQLGFARRHSFGTMAESACNVMDPRRGVACALIPGHKGDHESIGGFPFSRTQLDPDEKPSEADIEAAKSMLREAGIHADWDQPGRTAVAQDEPLVPCMEHEECDMEPCTYIQEAPRG